MKLDRIDALVAVFTVTTAVAALGMLLDIWQAVYYSIPVFVLLFMVLGSLNSRDRWSWSALVPVVVFGVVLAALFVAAGVLLGNDGGFGGLPASTALFLYVIWPYTVIGGPLAYAAVYQGWLSKDVEQGLEPAGA